MDKFLETYGMRVPVDQATGQSLNIGIPTKVSENKGKYYVNDIWTSYGRFFFCHFDVPTIYTGPDDSDADKEKQPTYSARILLNPAGCRDIEEACVAMAYAAKWPPVTYGDRVFTIEQRLFDPTCPSDLRIKTPLLDGNMTYAKDPVGKAVFQGVKYLNAKMYPASTKGVPQRPVCVGKSGEVVDGKTIYGGSYGAMRLDLATYTRKDATGIRANFDMVQMVADGDVILAGFSTENAARAAAVALGPVNFGSFATQPPPAPPGAVPQGFPPGGYPVQPPQGYPAQPPAQPPQGYPAQAAAAAPPPAPVWNAQTAQWELPQPAAAAAPAQAAWTPPPAGPNGFAPPPGQLPQQAALPPGAYPPPR